MILDHELLSADDVLLEPALGVLSSRSKAVITPFIFNAPMDRVVSTEFIDAMLVENEFVVTTRAVEDDIYASWLANYAELPNVFFSVGATQEEITLFLQRIEKAIELGLNERVKINVAIDIAHGHSMLAHKVTRYLSGLNFIGHVMSGSIATAEAALTCLDVGCTHLRIGIGNGTNCSTRLMTGVGVPQLSAVYLIHKTLCASQKRDQAILIADGGIRYPGDAVKYLCAGADAVMIGRKFANTKESPGWNIRIDIPDPQQIHQFPMKEPQTRSFKTYRGHASASYQRDTSGKVNRCPEGVESEVFEWNGETVHSLCEQYRGGVASAISYLGCEDIKELRPENVKFLKITNSAWIESQPKGS